METHLSDLPPVGLSYVDVRSSPYSKYVSHFNGNPLAVALRRVGIKYMFMGKELGGRPDGTEFYDVDSHVLYSRVATDIRLYQDDHTTPKGDLIEQINKQMQDGRPVILSVGLTRPFRPHDDSIEQHWLQVNNIHLK